MDAEKWKMHTRRGKVWEEECVDGGRERERKFVFKKTGLLAPSHCSLVPKLHRFCYVSGQSAGPGHLHVTLSARAACAGPGHRHTVRHSRGRKQ